MTDQLAQVLSRTAFCPDCHRIMEPTEFMDVPGEGQVAVDYKCHYCGEQFTTDPVKAAKEVPCEESSS